MRMIGFFNDILIFFSEDVLKEKRKAQPVTASAFTLMLTGVLLCAVLLAGCGRNGDEVLLSGTSDTGRTVSDRSDTAEDSEGSTKETASVVYVYVCGAVNHEGVYFLEEGDRVYKAIELAGGFRDDADTTVLNQAGIVTDGEMIRVPTVEEAVRLRENGQEVSGSVALGTGQTGQIGGQNGGTDSGETRKVNINTAASEELQTLPGVGSAKAAQIIAYREENGAFSEIEDIMKVPGIKQGSYEKLKDRITTGN